jgi:flagellar biogenesis protein FliO
MKTLKYSAHKKAGLATTLVLAGFTSAVSLQATAAEPKSTDLIAKSQQANDTASLNKAIAASAADKAALVPPIPAAEPVSQGTTFEVTAQRSGATTSGENSSAALGSGAVTGTINITSDPVNKLKDGSLQKTDSSAALSANSAVQNLTLTNTQQDNQNTLSQKVQDHSKTDLNKTETGTTQIAVVPNGAALQSQLIPLGNSDAFPWSGLIAGGFLILGIAAAGVLTVRLKQGRVFAGSRAEKQLQLITTMSLSPKRQIMLVRIRDKEVALASTEHGITMLTELQSEHSSSVPLLRDSGDDEPRRRKVHQKAISDEPVKLVSSQATYSEDAGQETAIARSEMLMGALKNLREKNLRNRDASTNQSTETSSGKSQSPEKSVQDRKVAEPADPQRSKSESTMKQTRAAFPKYLANAFEQESKRALTQNSNQNQSSQDDAGNVTNMIRERLKELRPLS